MKIVFGCDPNAAALKEELIEMARELGHEVVDMGGDDPVYANTAIAVAEAVAGGKGTAACCSAGRAWACPLRPTK